MKSNYIKCGDCLELMKEIPSNSIDMILCDLPYSSKNRKVTWNDWDCEIDLDELWKQYNRIIKENGAIVLFASDIFSAELINSNKKNYKYKWIWEKESGTGFLNSKRMPLRNFEELLVFYKKQCTYNPQMREGNAYITKKGSLSNNYCSTDKIVTTVSNGKRYPLTIIKFNREKNNYHPTQKPIELLKYMIKTYTNEGQVVLDNCMGSGSTCIAAKELNRRYIGFEIEKKYFEIAESRINNANKQAIEENKERQLNLFEMEG